MQKRKSSTSPKKNSSQSTLYKGRLDVSKSGMGYVIVEGQETDIKVKPNDFGKAFHGDTVRVKATKPNGNGRTEGVVTSVVERKQTEFTGTMQINNRTSFFLPSGEKGIPDFYVPTENLNGAVDGQRVLVELVEWGDKDRRPTGKVIQAISAKDEGDMAMKEIILQAGFPLQFEDKVLAQAEELSPKITRVEERARKDFRDVLTFTIDPHDAKDFDDAISIRNLDNGNYEIGIHIADVSHFVTEGSDLDKAAYARATSVYLPDRVNPMLPEKISNELCSLRPDEEKYTFSAVFQITNRFEVKQTWIGRTIIKSDRRFTYEEAQTIIETGEGDHAKAIVLLDKIAKAFRAERFTKGAINFSSTEVRFQLDTDGKPIGVTLKESKDSNKLVEEFMLLANRGVAEYVSKTKINGEKIPFPYRIHDNPDEEKLRPFAAFARKFGYTFKMEKPEEIADSFNKLMQEVQGKPEQHVLEQLGIRTMAKAVYSPDNVGHYGLGFEHYTHFTSPIRRYPDVMVHRILQQCIDKNVVPDNKMAEKSKHCSDKERSAMEAERASNKYKQVEYMQQFIGEEFEAVVSGVSNFGFWCETVLHKCEGLVSSRDLSDFDNFQLDEADYSLVGYNTGTKFRIGDRVHIKVVAANLDKRQLDYEWLPDRQLAGAAASKKSVAGKKKADVAKKVNKKKK